MKFGDLISFSRFGYNHWGVYNGKENGKDTVVEFAGQSGSDSKANATVKKSVLEPGAKAKVDNQLDYKYKPKSESEMKATIESLLKDGAGKYNVLGNNCEHVATLIRYGKKESLQAERVLDTQPNFNNQMAETFGASFLPRS